MATLAAALGGWSAANGESPVARLGWSQEESWDTHAWKEGDWWRPGDRSARARARARAANAHPTPDPDAGAPRVESDARANAIVPADEPTLGAMGTAPARAASAADVPPATSSSASRSAVWTGDSPSSGFPPGKARSPACVGMCIGRFVSTRRAVG